MGTALIKIKLMPNSPDVNLEEMKEIAKEAVESKKGSKVNFEIKPIAFGLKALIVGFALDEADELAPIENALREIEQVVSAEVVDMRRAFG